MDGHSLNRMRGELKKKTFHLIIFFATYEEKTVYAFMVFFYR